ncbi:MAG TPA: DUF6514 family protein [Oscillospiraceae bacterium]|nr:DUF6514 family protein [Oscillospiraceae bacterium]
MIALKEPAKTISKSAETVREAVLGGGHLIYSLIKSDALIDGKHACVYGVKIFSSLFSQNEVEVVKDISSNFETANELFDMLVDNIVLPCTLKDIAYDFLVSKY